MKNYDFLIFIQKNNVKFLKFKTSIFCIFLGTNKYCFLNI